MRTELQSLEGQKALFIATFEKYGTYRSKGVVGRSILLRDLKTQSGRWLADHTWINYTAGFDAAGEFIQGDLVQFTAWVKPYIKGYSGQRIEDRLKRNISLDYCLAYPRNVRKVEATICRKTGHNQINMEFNAGSMQMNMSGPKRRH